MGLKNKIFSGLIAGMMLFVSVGIDIDAAKIKVDQQIPAEEVESVYNQEVESNALKGWPAGPNIYSESGIVMDMDSGAILYEKKIDDQHYPASITKVLTALVALEHYELTDTVKFTQDCISFLEYGDAHIGMKPDEEISFEDALYGMLLASANEVSYAIANSCEGGYDHFIDMMNEKVTELGGKNSHFMNANGLHNDEHYTSVRDMALISSAVFQHEEFRKVTGTLQYTIGETAITNETRTFQQNHKMLFQGNQNYYEYCVGGKTGYTDQALTTLVTFATKDDKNLVAVTMRVHGGGHNAYADTRAMLDYAFDNFSKVPVTKEQVTDKNVKEVSEGASIMLPSGITIDKLDVQLEVSKNTGEKDGTLIYTYEGEDVGKVPVTITDKYYNKLHGIEEKQEVKGDAQKEKKEAEKGSVVLKCILGVVIIAVVLLVILMIFVLYRRRQIRERRRRARMRRRKKEKERLDRL